MVKFIRFHPGIMPILLVVMLWLTSSAMAANFEVIANKNVMESSLLKAELQAIFLGEKVKWGNKRYIKIATFENGVFEKDFLSHVVNKTPSQFDQHWKRLNGTGRANMPPNFSDVQQLIDYVAKQPYAIGVVPAGQANGSVKKLIYIDGDKE
jgi:ABC-type phosphate transport system substrate-binding protein